MKIEQLTYEEKKKLANNYLNEKVGLSWNDLPDINSLHDCEDEETIYEYCDERIEAIYD